MDVLLVAAVVVGLAFDASNGFHDSSNSIATLVATRAARPLPAIAMATIFTMLGLIVVATAVRNRRRCWCSPARCWQD